MKFWHWGHTLAEGTVKACSMCGMVIVFWISFLNSY